MTTPMRPPTPQPDEDGSGLIALIVGALAAFPAGMAIGALITWLVMR